MQKNILFFIVIVLLLVANCKKAKELLTFDINQKVQFTVPSSTILNLPISLPHNDINTSYDNEYANNNTSVDLVEKVILKKLILTITEPASQNFNFLESVYLYISADGLPEILIASKEAVSENINSLPLDVEDKLLDEYIKKDKFKVKVNVTTDETIAQDIEIDADMTFQVTAKPL